MQQEIRQKPEQQAVLMEIHKLRKDMDHFKAERPGGAVSAVVGVAQLEGEVGAVGGDLRNMFSTALEESEQATSKMKGKDEVSAKDGVHCF